MAGSVSPEAIGGAGLGPPASSEGEEVCLRGGMTGVTEVPGLVPCIR